MDFAQAELRMAAAVMPMPENLVQPKSFLTAAEAAAKIEEYRKAYPKMAMGTQAFSDEPVARCKAGVELTQAQRKAEQNHVNDVLPRPELPRWGYKGERHDSPTLISLCDEANRGRIQTNAGLTYTGGFTSTKSPWNMADKELRGIRQCAAGRARTAGGERNRFIQYYEHLTRMCDCVIAHNTTTEVWRTLNEWT